MQLCFDVPIKGVGFQRYQHDNDMFKRTPKVTHLTYCS